MKQTIIVEQFDNGITIKSEEKQVFKVVENASDKQERNESKYANHLGGLIYPDISRFMNEQCTSKVRIEISLTDEELNEER